MAYYNIKFFSNSLCRHVNFEMIIPNDKRDDQPWKKPVPEGTPMKTLLLLHGYTGSAFSWIEEETAEKYHVAIIIPNGENSFYLDGKATGHAFCKFVGEELPEYVAKTFGFEICPENTGVLGFSMGGFGALHTGLAYPDRFGKIGAMSSALIQHEVAGMKEGVGNSVANYDYYKEVFGEPKDVLDSDNNPETLIDKLISSGKKIPEIYQCCGTEDFLLENNRQFHAFLEDKKVEHIYKESAGNHDMVFWHEYTGKILEWMFG